MVSKIKRNNAFIKVENSIDLTIEFVNVNESKKSNRNNILTLAILTNLVKT